MAKKWVVKYGGEVIHTADTALEVIRWVRANDMRGTIVKKIEVDDGEQKETKTFKET